MFPIPAQCSWVHRSTSHPVHLGVWSRGRRAPPGTCAVATPGRRLQSPPPPPPGSAVTSCSCFPVGPVGLTFESALSRGEGSAGPAEKVVRREAGLSLAGRARSGDGGGRPGRTRRPDSRRVPEVPVSAGNPDDPRSRGTRAPGGCGFSTCPPREGRALLLFIWVVFEPLTCSVWRSGACSRLALAPAPASWETGIPSFVMASLTGLRCVCARSGACMRGRDGRYRWAMLKRM